MPNDITANDYSSLPSDLPNPRLPSDHFQRLPSSERPREIHLPSETRIVLPSDIPARAPKRGS